MFVLYKKGQANQVFLFGIFNTTAQVQIEVDVRRRLVGLASRCAASRRVRRPSRQVIAVPLGIHLEPYSQIFHREESGSISSSTDRMARGTSSCDVD